MNQKAVPAGDLLKAYMKAAAAIFGTARHDVEQVAGFMYPGGSWDGYQVSVRIVRHVDEAVRLAALMAKATRLHAVAQAKANGSVKYE